MEIREPDITRGRKSADFGPGFYLTPDVEFTYRWAGADAVVNKYELDAGLRQAEQERYAAGLAEVTERIASGRLS